MKFYFTLILVPFFLFSCGNDKKSKSETTVTEIETTYYLIRHAEKDRSDKTNRNPELNKVGQARATAWATHFKDIDLDLIYSTNYNRTQQTATPTAVSKGLEIKEYNPSSMYDDHFKAATKGKVVLVVGHSNTTPAFVNAILGKKKYEDLDDSENGMLFTVTVTMDGAISKVEKINPL